MTPIDDVSISSHSEPPRWDTRLVEEHARVVEKMWDAYRRDGLEGILQFAAADAVWRPHSADGREFATTDEYRDFIVSMSGRNELVDATLVSVEPHEDFVVVHGRLRVRRQGAIEDSPMVWVHRFRGDKVVFTASAPRRADALALAQLEPA
jgi:ketosteroid isomerase-like protein